MYVLPCTTAPARARPTYTCDARLGSDIDVLVDLDPQHPIGLFEYAGIKLDIAELLGGSLDVSSTRKTLKSPLREAILRDTVKAL